MDVGTKKRWIIVGLGNPGLDYSGTRHNMGNLVVRMLASRLGWGWKSDTSNCVTSSRGIINSANIYLALPTTYMNESGRAVRRYLNYYRATADELVVVTDDVALPFGELRLRENGSSGGHNGLKSIEENLGTQRFMRLRIGVGKPCTGQDLADYVLERFNAEQADQLQDTMDKGAAALLHLIHHSVEHAMNQVNAKDWHWRNQNYEY